MLKWRWSLLFLIQVAALEAHHARYEWNARRLRSPLMRQLSQNYAA